jgi:HEAT repeat protein
LITFSDPYLAAAFWMGLAAVVATLLLSLVIIGLRLRLRRAQRRWDDFLLRWRPALLAVIVDEAAAPLPALRADEQRLFLRLWTYLHESVRGDATQRLNDAARSLGMDATARRLLVGGSRAEKLQAVLAAGYLRDEAAWPALAEMARSPDSLLSVNAARAMVRIHPLRSARGLMPLLVTRQDWDLSRVAAFLGEARQAFWVHMTRVVPRLAPPELARTLLLADALRLQLPDATLARLLAPDQSPELLCAALPLCDSPTLADAVRGLLAHADASVRAAAARQMAGLAEAHDRPRLVALLQDAEWRVRMAAADTLGRLPFVTTPELLALQLRHPAANAMLRQVVAERERA